MKKLWTVFLALVLVLSMTAIATAEGTTPANTNTITAPNNGHTYEILQIFTGDLHQGTLANLVWGVNGKDYGTLDKDDASVPVPVPEETIAALMATEAAGENATRNFIVNMLLSSADALETIGMVNGEFVESATVPAGYYMIRDKADSLTGKNDSYTLYIVKVTGNVTITPKADTPSLTKKIWDINDTTGVSGGWQDSADYDIGDEVPYLLTATVANNFASYKGAYKLVFHDEMEEGLTFQKDSVKVYIGDTLEDEALLDPAQYTVTAAEDNHGFTLTIDDLKRVTYGSNETKVKVGDKICVSFSAELNDNAFIGAKGNLNTAYLEFANNPNSEQPEMGETPKDTVIAFTYQLVINKVHRVGDDLVPLTGAEFTLEKNINNNTWVKVDRVDVTDAGTVFTFKGLDDGEYRLTESKVPDGYNKMADVIFTVSAEHVSVVDDLSGAKRYEVLKSLTGNAVDGVITLNATTTKETVGVDDEEKDVIEGLGTSIENKSGAQLPETGGIGTTIFYLLGGMMFVGAALILVVRRKAEADEN